MMHRYVAIEHFYWGPEIVLNEHFEDALVVLYCKILEYQAKAAHYFSIKMPYRTLRNILQIDSWAALIQEVTVLDTVCTKLFEVESLSNILDVISAQSQHFETLVEGLKRSEEDDTKITDWISDVSVYGIHLDATRKLGSNYRGSGTWLLERQEFNKWKAVPQGQIWLHGTVGTGKSCLTSIVISHLLQTFTKERLAFFYCEDTTNPTTILRCLVAQLSWSADGKVVSSIKKYYDANRKKDSAGICLGDDECAEWLVELIKHHEYTTIVIDALDECTSPSTLLRTLEKVSKRSQKLKLFFSSREGSRVSESMSRYFPDSANVRVDQSKNCKDIEFFVEGELKAGCDLNLIPDELATRLQKVLIDRADGM